MKQFAFKKNIFITLTFCLLCGLFSTIGVNMFYQAKSIKQVIADTNYTGVNVLVQKITSAGTRAFEGDDYYIYDEDADVISSSTVNINPTANDNYVMLNNALLEDTDSTNKKIERLKITIFPKEEENKKIQMLKVSATLNGQEIFAGEVDENPTLGDSYTRYIDLHNVTDKNENLIFDAQGHYEFSFEYFLVDDYANAVGYTNKTFDFYLMNEDTYVSKEEAGETNSTNNENQFYNNYNNRLISAYNEIGTEPSLKNTIKTARETLVAPSEEITVVNEQNFYNYQTEEIPSLIYDASKYNVSYTKILNSIKTKMESSFIINQTSNNGELTLIYYDLVSNNWIEKNRETITIEPRISPYIRNSQEYNNYNYIFELNFKNLGQYEFTINYLTKNENGFVIANGESLRAEVVNWCRIGNVNLDIFGLQPYFYNYTNSAFEEFKSDGFNSDITANNSSINTDNYSALTDATTIESPIDDANLCITDQAPVKLNLFGEVNPKDNEITFQSQYRYYPSGEKVGTPTILAYNNNTRFNSNGYYEVVVYYTYSEYKEGTNNAALTIHVQVFAFKISNIAPSVSLQKGDESPLIAIQNNSFANQTVTISWETEQGPFYVTPMAEVQRSAFGTTLNYQTILEKNIIENNILSYSDNGHYKIILYYGANNENTSVYKFTIDKTNIENIKLNYLAKDISSYFYEAGEIADNQSTMINNPFVLEYNNKLSGAPITITYSLTPLEKITDSISSGNFIDVDKNYIHNNYQLTGTIQNVAYTKNNVSDTSPLTGTAARSVLNQPGLYIFTLIDAAGNKSTKVVFYDNTSPLVLQSTDGSVFTQATYNDNIVSETTNIYYGTHKAVKLDDTVKNLLLDLNLDFLNGDYLLVPITVANYKTASTQLDVISEQMPFSNIIANGNHKELSNATEGFHNFVIIDKSSVINNTNTYSNNQTNVLVEINLDKSLFLAYSAGDIYTEGDTNNNNYNVRLYDTGTTNRQLLRFQYKSNVDTDYEVVELSCIFYPFSFEKTTTNGEYRFNDNYPFSNTGRTIDLLDLAQPVVGNTNYDRIITEINLSYNSLLSANVTQEGKYVITRTYQNGEEKIYTYIVDRNEIIDNANIGSFIALVFGPETNTKIFSGAEFLNKIINNTPLDISTNLLPMNTILPISKYAKSSVNSNSTSSFYTENIDALKLNLSLIRNYNNGNTEKTEEYTFDVLNNRYVLKSVRESGSSTHTAITDNYLFKAGTYTLTISDNTGYYNETLKQIICANKFGIKFEIVHEKPYGAFYTKDNQELVGVTSYKNSDIKFVWEDPTNPYKARVDHQNFEVSKDGTVVFKYVNNIATVNNGFSLIEEHIEGTRYKYSIEFPSNAEEGNYQVTIYYEGEESFYNYDDNTSFYSNTYSFYIDKTAPLTNLTNLLHNDNYLTGALSTYKSIENFMNKDSSINFENYTFAISKNDMLTFANNYDTKDVYIRKYNKYKTADDNTYYNLQSLVENDPDFQNGEMARLKFNPLITDSHGLVYTKFSYGTSFADYSPGYYEIIEIDEAGNQRIYSVLILDDYSFELETNLIEFEKITTNTTISLIDLSFENISSGVKIADEWNFEEIDSWYQVNIINGVKNTNTTLYKTVTLSNEINIFQTNEKLLEKINQLITLSNEYVQTGSIFTITFKSRFGDNLVITYNTPGAKIMPTATPTGTGFILTLPRNTATTQIINFKVYKYDATQNNFLQINYDSTQAPISSTITEEGGMPKTYSFVSTSGVYKFTLTDNFGRIYDFYHIIGVTDIKEMVYGSSTQTVGDITYTAGSIALIYEPKLYTVNITKNGILQTVYNIIPLLNGTNKIILCADATILNLNDAFVITLTSVIDGAQTVYKCNYYTLMPNYQLLDSGGQDIGNIIDNITAKTVYFVYSNDNVLFPFNISATRTFVNANNQTIIQNLGLLQNNASMESYGEYEISFTSSLGKLTQIKFTIKDLSKPNFAVVTNVIGQTSTVINPSSVKYVYENNTIDQYFVNGDYSIELNQDKKLIKEMVYGENTNTTVWRIRSEQETNGIYLYDKYIVVHTVNLSTNIISSSQFLLSYEGEDGEIEEEPLFGTNYITTNNPSVVRWGNIFGAETLPDYQIVGNHITCTYYFNGTYAGASDVGAINIYNSGIYDFYFEDLSGNNHVFGTSLYYRLYVINEPVFTVNNKTPINNAIYNSTVTIEMQQTSLYKYGTLGLVAKLNGTIITPNKTSLYVYNFSAYGVYSLTISAIMEIGSELKQISCNYKFTIINQNAARYAHEYTGASGYEITKVVRDGRDITADLRILYQTASLTSIVVNPTNGGVGNYTVFVTANFLGARPSQSFSYNFWINNESPAILSSINPGDSTTNEIALTFNRYLIYSQLGDCGIYLNGQLYDNINASTSAVNQIVTKTLTENKTYLVQLKSSTGNTLLSFVITKNEPLNTIAIIIIVVSSLVVITLTAIFFKLRTKMKIK